MNFFELMDANPWLTLVLGMLLGWYIVQIIEILFVTLPNKILRHWNIRKHGFPPKHCDADGDPSETD